MATSKLTFVITKNEDGSFRGVAPFRKELDGMDAGRYKIEVSRYRRSRSNKQNAYYWGGVVPAVASGLIDMGFAKNLINAESVHELLKNKFLVEEIEGVASGEFLNITKSTSDLSTTEFMDYIAEIQQWATEWLKIYIPDPGEQTEIDY